MRFRTVVVSGGKTATGLEVPPEVVEALGAGKRAPVRVTLNGATYRSSLAVMRGRHLISLSAENRALTGASAGDEVDVDVEVDDEPRVVEVPADLAGALDADADARTSFDGLPYSGQRRIVLAVEAAKTDTTRVRRIEGLVAKLRAGQL